MKNFFAEAQKVMSFIRASKLAQTGKGFVEKVTQVTT